MRSRASGSKLPSACWTWASVISGWFSGVSSPIVRTEMTCQPNWERTGDEMLPLPASRAIAELGDVADGRATTEVAADRRRSIAAALDGKGCEVGTLVEKGDDLFGLRCRVDEDVT